MTPGLIQPEESTYESPISHKSSSSPQWKALDVERVLQDLTVDEKVSLTAGIDFWHTAAVPRLGIPSLRLSDGPNGVRGTRFFDSVPSACLPCGTALGATFNSDLLLRVGHLLAAQAKAKGAHVLLGPTINMQRSPLGGRGFESYSEDPHLAGVLAGEYCKGVEEKGVVATLKHFVCNDQEHQRMAYNAIVTDRALREIYLQPFQIAIKMAQPGAVMTAYNKINGTHVSESTEILQSILRDEWKWKGLVMSDWFGTYSTTGAINAGLDLEMPGPSRWRGQALSHAITSNKVKIHQLDERVRAVLELVNRAQHSRVPENGPEGELNRPVDRKILREAATESIVLLKNERNVLPFRKDRRVAVIGPNSKIATYCGGGSASLNPYYTVTPFEGVEAKVTSQIDFSQGAYGHQSLPTIGKQLRTVDGKPGFTMKVYNEGPERATRHLLEQRLLTDSTLFFADYKNSKLAPTWYADADGLFTAPESGIYDFGLSVQGTGRLYIDGELIVSNFENQRSGPSFFGSGTVEETGSKRLEAGREYRILVQWGCAKTSKMKKAKVLDFGHGGLRFSGCKRLDPQQALAHAVQLAQSVDQVVLFAGLSGEWETEGHDREHMDLPPGTDDLIAKILEANPNTVVVLQSGTPVSMPWADKASTLLHAWYGGNETGNAIADVLFGDVNPSGKLPLTFPRRIQDNPAYINYRTEGGRTLYGEDIYVGYRWFDKLDIKPLFPFGHGLSYTTFKLSSLRLERESATHLKVHCTVANTGRAAGSQVVQVYIAPPASPNVGRPVKELKGFQKVFLEPGEEAGVEIDLRLDSATSYWDENRDMWCSEAGTYRVLVGDSSAPDTFLEASFLVEESKWWLGL